jgi:plastocyanin
MPESGRVVAAGGHVHGGAKNLAISEPDCGDRVMGTSDPTWGLPGHPFYNVKPVLHEPGPIHMTGFGSAKGFPVARGQRLRLTARYDNELPHTRVMGIAMAYVAPDESAPGCGERPDDVFVARSAEPGRSAPPRYKVPLTGLGRNGRARTIKAPPGKRVELRSGDTIVAKDYSFSRPNVEVERGTRLRWRFDGLNLHNVTLANGPRGFSSVHLNGGRRYAYKFDKPGDYQLFCALHPVDMTETVKVK